MGENCHQLFTYKGLKFKRHRELKKINSKRTNNPMNKWANEHFSEETQMTNELMKKCSHP
jgi:hypothetical protein